MFTENSPNLQIAYHYSETTEAQALDMELHLLRMPFHIAYKGTDLYSRFEHVLSPGMKRESNKVIFSLIYPPNKYLS